MHCCGFMSLLLPFSCPACSIPVTSHPSVCGFALLPQAPPPKARSEDDLAERVRGSDLVLMCTCTSLRLSVSLLEYRESKSCSFLDMLWL